jgi:hypothetical protein
MHLTYLVTIVQQLIGIVAVEMVLFVVAVGIEVVGRACTSHGSTVLNEQTCKHSKLPVISAYCLYLWLLEVFIIHYLDTCMGVFHRRVTLIMPSDYCRLSEKECLDQ